jgi:hypothetical protein
VVIHDNDSAFLKDGHCVLRIRYQVHRTSTPPCAAGPTSSAPPSNRAR